MSECLRCGRDLIDPNAKYGWRCSQKVGIPYGDSIVKKFPELEKLYNSLSEKSQKEFDAYFDEMEEKNSYVDTAIEGAGILLYPTNFNFDNTTDEIIFKSKDDAIVEFSFIDVLNIKVSIDNLTRDFNRPN